MEKAFKIVIVILITWTVLGVICMATNVPFHPYGDYWFNIALVLIAIESLILILLFRKKK